MRGQSGGLPIPHELTKQIWSYGCAEIEPPVQRAIDVHAVDVRRVDVDVAAVANAYERREREFSRFPGWVISLGVRCRGRHRRENAWQRKTDQKVHSTPNLPVPHVPTVSSQPARPALGNNSFLSF